MILLFFEQIIEDAKTTTPTEDLVAFLKKAYKEALEPYHGWMAQQLFDVSQYLPRRTHKRLFFFLLLCKMHDLLYKYLFHCMIIFPITLHATRMRVLNLTMYKFIIFKKIISNFYNLFFIYIYKRLLIIILDFLSTAPFAHGAYTFTTFTSTY